MSRHYQDSKIEFRKQSSEDPEYPESRGIVVYQYGGTIEEGTGPTAGAGAAGLFFDGLRAVCG